MRVYEVWLPTNIIEEYWWLESALEIAAKLESEGDGPVLVYERRDGVRTRLR